MSKVRKAIIPAAGFGTRFLPASKAIPKVMFPVIDKPIVQLVVEELVEAGINDITFVLSSFTQDVKEHFEPFEELNQLLEKSGKTKELQELKRIESMAHFSYIEQKSGRHGIGMAVLSATQTIGEEDFVLAWADEFYQAKPGRFTQLLNVYEKYGGAVLGCIKSTDPNDGLKYGFADGQMIEENVMKVKGLVEKPGVGKAPSDLAVVSGMVLPAKLLYYLDKANKEFPPEKELYHMDGLKMMLADNFPVYALEYQNCRYFDTGDRYIYLKTLVEMGLQSEEFGKEFREFLKSIKY